MAERLTKTNLARKIHEEIQKQAQHQDLWRVRSETGRGSGRDFRKYYHEQGLITAGMRMLARGIGFDVQCIDRKVRGQWKSVCYCRIMKPGEISGTQRKRRRA